MSLLLLGRIILHVCKVKVVPKITYKHKYEHHIASTFTSQAPHGENNPVNLHCISIQYGTVTCYEHDWHDTSFTLHNKTSLPVKSSILSKNTPLGDETSAIPRAFVCVIRLYLKQRRHINVAEPSGYSYY